MSTSLVETHQVCVVHLLMTLQINKCFVFDFFITTDDSSALVIQRDDCQLSAPLRASVAVIDEISWCEVSLYINKSLERMPNDDLRFVCVCNPLEITI